MGNCCPCFGSDQDEKERDSHKKRLIGTDTPEPQYGTASNEHHTVIAKEPRSARLYRPSTPDSSVQSLDEATEIKLKEIPIQSIHKRFQDQTNLYNDLLDNYKSLRSAVHSFKEMFVEDTGGIPVWVDCMKYLHQRCGNADIDVVRRKYSIELKYDARNLSQNTDLSVDSIIPAIELFNRCNKLVRNNLERCPHVQKSLSALLDEEESVKKEIAKIDLSGEIGPEALKACIEDMKMLRCTPIHIDEIRRYSDRLFNDIVNATQVMVQ